MKSFQRQTARYDRQPLILLSFEGTKTEKNYFESLCQHHGISISPVPHRGTDPKSVVQAVADSLKQTKNNLRWRNSYDQAWAIFDVDDYNIGTPAELENWNAARQQARDLGINLAINSPCFELWYLLHFEDQNACITRRKLIQKIKLNPHLKDYKKSDILYPHPLKPTTQAALQRSLRMHERAQNQGLDEFHHLSCHGVATLVDILLNIKLP